MNTKLIRIIACAVLLAGAVWTEHNVQLECWQLLLVYMIPYLLIGYDVIGEALEGVLHGEAFDEDFLMCVATIGALLIGFLPGAEAQYPEAVFVMLFFQVGELFEDYAEDKSRKSISHLMGLHPDTANVMRDGQLQVVDPATVTVGETIVVKPGEKVPLDGVVTGGDASLNTVALTGESMPRTVHVGDDVISGCVDLNGALTVKTTKSFGESTASKIIELVENAGTHKSKSESFITLFARIYTPIVVGIAVVLAIVPPLFSGDFVASFSVWLYRALTFLIVSCPCALVISVPLSFFGGIGGASRHGILIKGSNYMDVLAKLDTVVFDKTGTLTKGKFEVTAVHPDHISENQLLHMAAHAERFSNHPIALSLKDAFPNEQDGCEVSDVEELAGKGVRARINDTVVCVGNEKLMQTIGAQWRPCHKTGTIIHVAVDSVYAGHIVISDTIKEDSREAVQRLKTAGVRRTVMLTGDHQSVGAYVASELSLDEYKAELLPADKVKAVERLLREKPVGRALAFVGDGINDAPVLARADIGIAMGALGSDAAIEAADIVLMNDNLSSISTAMAISGRTHRIVKQNIVFALTVKAIVLILSALGLSTMWAAVFADVGVSVLAILNAMRALK